ncbi:MAG TPA: MOSC domain-containing protein [Nitrososphaerales archaeon]|nr:MOSC domain-containing protein [Nitrososphaerales archaeon]
MQQTETPPKGAKAPVGSVVSLLRYPIKSMIGEELTTSHVTELGLLGDRTRALVDQTTGRVVSAKNPRKWGRLFDFRASFADPPTPGDPLPDIRISLPDGRVVMADQLGTDDVLSEALGAQVRLMTAPLEEPSLEEYWPDVEGLANREKVTEEVMPARTFFDAASVHVLTTATTDRLQELYPEGRFEARRFRPNLVVETAQDVKGFVENDWVGRTLRVGEQVRLKVSRPCGRCVMTTLAQGDLPQDLGILRTVARHNNVRVGVYASVERGGHIQRADPVWLE